MGILLLHGGASNLSDDVNLPKKRATDAVAELADCRGKSAIDIVEESVSCLEDKIVLNAGMGSILQLDGRIRNDAGICSSDRKYGAVIQVEQIRNPIKVARKLMDYNYHSILSGDGAQKFAVEEGFELENLYTEHAFNDFMKSRKDIEELKYSVITSNADEINVKKLSTVGAVALDDEGKLASACSTGGTKFCYPGRVGDTPIFGAGLYCSDKIAIALTGEGDKVLRMLTSKRIEEIFVASGNLKEALEQAMDELLKIENGYGGAIAVSSDGQFEFAHTTSFMAHALKKW